MASGFNYSVLLPFERSFDQAPFHQWIKANWTLSFWFSGVYVCFIFGAKHYMADRPKFELRPTLALWSGALAIFSILGAVRTLPELIFMVRTHGWARSVCDPSCYLGPTVFWYVLFTVSKVYELGDTVFVVLRKQPLILLHWYHHVSVLVYVWYTYTDHTAPGRWFITMNYTVHSVMYSYYCLKALQVRVPKSISMLITVMQITQMVVGILVNVRVLQIKQHNQPCQQSDANLRYSLLMYLSYLILFSYFFYDSYFSSKKQRKAIGTQVNGKLASANIANGAQATGKPASTNGTLNKKIR